MQLLYFGWVRQKIGEGAERLTLPDGVTDVAGLIAHLSARGGGYQAAFEDVSALRVAINQEMAQLDAPITDADEVALFPPMTGGIAGEKPVDARTKSGHDDRGPGRAPLPRHGRTWSGHPRACDRQAPSRPPHTGHGA